MEDSDLSEALGYIDAAAAPTPANRTPLLHPLSTSICALVLTLNQLSGLLARHAITLTSSVQMIRTRMREIIELIRKHPENA